MTRLDEVYYVCQDKLHQMKLAQRRPTEIRLWDGNWQLIGAVSGNYKHDFEWLENDAGTASLQLPLDHYISELLLNPRKWPTQSIYATFDRGGARWSGRLETSKVEYNAAGQRFLELTFIYDYIKLKELLAWPNPFLPAEVQFPKAYVAFGPAKWVVAQTIFLNLLRKNASLWMLPDDPLDLRTWFDLDQSNWNMTVAPIEFGKDNSMLSTVVSRFKTVHDAVKDVCTDAQISIECRRWLEGDPAPYPGAHLRNGCLVFRVVDKSGWNTGTSFFGNIRQGFERAVKRYTGEYGLDESTQLLELSEQPQEYSDREWAGTVPSAPWAVLSHGDDSPVTASEYTYTPPGASQFVTGGSSMAGVNEAISASVIALGGFIGSWFGQSQVGAAAAEVLKPLYTDVFLAFMAHKHLDRIRQQGWDYPYEYWVDGAEKAYSISGIIAMRVAKDATRAKHSASVTLHNGAPYVVGPPGYGDFFIGDRVGVHALGMPKNEVFVEQVKSLKYDSESADWDIEVGLPDYKSGFSFLVDRVGQFMEGLKETKLW